jgi:hypothetical protein
MNMGKGLRRVARVHGGIKVTADGKTVHYKTVKCDRCDGMGSMTDELSGQPLLCLDCDCTGVRTVQEQPAVAK